MPSSKHSRTMRHDQWHYRWYHTWVNLGGEPPKYKENLCHYVHVLLFWAPMRWFMFWRLVRFVTPAMIVSAAGSIAGLVFIALNWPGRFLFGWEIIGVLVGVVVGAGLISLGLSELYDRWPVGFKKFWKWISCPLWVLPYGISRAGKWAMRRTRYVRHAFLGWYIYSFYLKVLNPLVLTVLGALAALFYFETHFMVHLLVIVGCGAAGLVGAVLILMALFWVKDRKGFWNGVKDTIKLGATYANTKKQGSLICPFIEFEASDS